jgi:hypothetical protein
MHRVYERHLNTDFGSYLQVFTLNYLIADDISCSCRFHYYSELKGQGKHFDFSQSSV